MMALWVQLLWATFFTCSSLMRCRVEPGQHTWCRECTAEWTVDTHTKRDTHLKSDMRRDTKIHHRELRLTVRVDVHEVDESDECDAKKGPHGVCAAFWLVGPVWSPWSCSVLECRVGVDFILLRTFAISSSRKWRWSTSYSQSPCFHWTLRRTGKWCRAALLLTVFQGMTVSREFCYFLFIYF